MQKKICHIIEAVTLAALTIIVLTNSAWAGPPAPPVILEQLPKTPVGGTEISIVTAVGIAAYGMWRSRR